MTYAGAGVDIDRKSAAVRALVSTLGRRGPRTPEGRQSRSVEGHYTSLIPFKGGYLTICTDTVGSKILVAQALGKWDTIGIDCVAMNVNDNICVNSAPLGIVDTISLDEPQEEVCREIGRGLAEGARQSGCEVVGGEIAVVPDLVNGIDLGGTCVGFVEEDAVITGEAIRPGDAIIAIGSSGIHCNGLTLARKIVELKGWKLTDRVELERSKVVIGQELLRPTPIYVKEVLECCRRGGVTGLANITGGGVRNLLRLRSGARFVLDWLSDVPPVFKALQRWGKVEEREMWQTFNMGVGFAIVCRDPTADDLTGFLESRRRKAWRVGHVEKGEGVAIPSLGLLYTKY
jgi:phosphoribosylformylglycinamidine cyclo-ligase